MAGFSNSDGALPEAGLILSGNYVADMYNHTIRKVSRDGVVTTLAGMAGISSSADGTGTAARFYWPEGVAVDSVTNVYVADRANNAIRVGTPACADQPTIDLTTAPVGLTRQLNTSPKTVVAWQWSLIAGAHSTSA